MEIMSHDEWMLRTFKGGARSANLQRLDAALLAYERARSVASLHALDGAMIDWAADDVEFQRFDADGACGELFFAIEDELAELTTRAKTDLAAAKQAAALRPANFQRDLWRNRLRMKLERMDGHGKFSRAALAKIVKDPEHGNVSYEGFDGRLFDVARHSWRKVLECDALRRTVRCGSSPVFVRWFGGWDEMKATERADMTLRFARFSQALRTRPITFVLRESRQMHEIDRDRPLGNTVDYAMSRSTLAYVWDTVGQSDTRGMRIVVYRPAVKLGGPDGKSLTQTMVHEISHKVIGTSDTAKNSPAEVYGTRACQALAVRDPSSARNLADCWGYYYWNLLNPRL